MSVAAPLKHQWQRDELRDAVNRLANAMFRGDVEPDPDELRALAEICAINHLPIEAARVRRWLQGGNGVTR